MPKTREDVLSWWKALDHKPAEAEFWFGDIGLRAKDGQLFTMQRL